MDESSRLFDEMATRAAESGEAGESYVRDMFAQLAGRRLANSRDTDTTAETAAWLADHVGEPYADRTVVAQTAGQLSAEDPDRALAWLDSLERLPAGSTEPAGYAAVVRAMTATNDLNTVGEWLNAHRDHPAYGRLVIPHAGNVAAEDPQAAQVWVDSISNPVLRQRAVEEVERRSAGRD